MFPPTPDDRNEIASHYVTAFKAHGSRCFIANLETQVDVMAWGDISIPITINQGSDIDTFVCSPLTTYISYTREELRRLPDQTLVPLLQGVVSCMAGLLSMANVNRIVHFNNWMLSTNLPAELDPGQSASQTTEMMSRFPTHILAMRSLTRRQNGPLMQALENCGWAMIPSRQIYLVGDVTRDSLSRRDARNDHRVFQATALHYEEASDISADDARRIADLYECLYLKKYSYLNPEFTAAFVQMTHAIGMIRYLLLRDNKGHIMGFGGFYRAGNHATMPLMGYDTAAPKDLNLYRLVCHVGSLYAAKNSLELNMSSGASRYKITRGGQPEMEFTAYYFKHLPLARRLPMQTLKHVGDKIGIPILRRYEL